MKYSDYKAYQKAEWLGQQMPKVFTRNKTQLMKHTNFHNEIETEEKYTWKDYIYIIPGFLLLAVIIASAVIHL